VNQGGRVASTRICWLSLDPVRRAVNFYPYEIATKLEVALSEGEEACALGADFFNATVHFQANGVCYQTTPGQHMGRSGFKAPGYRSVKRLLHPAAQSTVQVHGKRVHGEWRLVDTQTDAEYTFTEAVPMSCLLSQEEELEVATLQPWTAEDLRCTSAEDLARGVIIWQWCRGTPEADGDLLRLSDDKWCPYMQADNATIERAFQNQEQRAEISLAHTTATRKLQIMMNPGSSHALQRDEANQKERAVRRVVKTIQELNEMHERMKAQEQLIEGIGVPNEFLAAAPPDFFCPITQDIMRNPVCTVDGHTYEREAIEQWFDAHNTSPLTGLPLASLNLRPNLGLIQQIQHFTQTHSEQAGAEAASAATTSRGGRS